jgi:hypothetical protein
VLDGIRLAVACRLLMTPAMRALLVSSLLASSSLYAQPAPPPTAPPPAPLVVEVERPPRQGLELGAGLWGGNMQCESQNGKCDGFSAAGGANIQASYFFNPRWAIAFDGWGMAHTDNNLTLSHIVSTVGLKWRPVPAITLHAGIGDAHAEWSYAGIVAARSDNAFAVMAAASLELIAGRRWALSVEARIGTGFYGDANGDGMADITARNEGLGAQLAFFGF